MKLKLAIVLAATMVPLSGCIYGGQPPLSANVAVFNTLDQVPKNATFSVVAWRLDLDRNLEFRSYALEPTKIIEKNGYRTSAGQRRSHRVALAGPDEPYRADIS
jgi:hypothetical protein